MSRLRRLVAGLIALLLALAAVPVGVAFVARPDGAWVGMPRAVLAGTPFADFRIPGLLLSAVVGGATLAASALALGGSPRARWAVLVAGVVVAGWIAVQVALIGYVSPLQPVIGALGLALCGLAAVPSRRATR